jgi:hypothetical protein
VSKLLFPHHEGAGSPNPIRVRGLMNVSHGVRLDTTVEHSLLSSAGGIRGRKCVRDEDGSPRVGKGWLERWVRYIYIYIYIERERERERYLHA